MSEQFWTVTISLTREQFDDLTRAADAAGQPVSVYATGVLAEHKPAAKKQRTAAKT
jgi:hypothetical protein